MLFHVLVDSYWSHIQDFQESMRRNYKLVRSPSFSTFSKFQNSQKQSPRKILPEMIRYLSWTICSNFCVPKPPIIGLGSHGHVRHIRKPWKMSCRVFLKWIRKVTSPNLSRIILRSFWATVFFKSTMKMPPTPQTPKTSNSHFSWISQIVYRKSAFLRDIYFV